MEKIRPIPQETVERVKERANIADVLRALGVELQRDGAQGEWRAFSPFRADKHMGSFKVSENKNICTDFATGESWDSIDAVMEIEHKTFNEAVRMIASMVGIYIDDTPPPKVEKLKPREQVPELPLLLYADVKERTKPYSEAVEESNLVKWMRSLPLDQKHLNWALKAYMVGMARNGKYKGWTVWWVINELGYLQTGKLMAYKEDGHRDKTLDEQGREKTTWAHTLWARAGMYDSTKYQAKTGMFGLHLMNLYKGAQVMVVESEKTAVLMSTFYDPEQVIWMATGGLSTLRNRLERLIKNGRDIILWPDKDGFEKWQAEAERIGYERMRVLTPKEQGWTEEDGPKADVADIMVRRLTTTTTTTTIGQRVAIMAGMPEKAGDLDHLIEALDLVEENV